VREDRRLTGREVFYQLERRKAPRNPPPIEAGQFGEYGPSKVHKRKERGFHIKVFQERLPFVKEGGLSIKGQEGAPVIGLPPFVGRPSRSERGTFGAME
jgi:hypothetical protein